MYFMEYIVIIPGKLSLHTIDFLAFAWFAFAWLGYEEFTNRYAEGNTTSLLMLMHRYRVDWMRQLLRRDNRITDMTCLGNLTRSVSFFASTSILIALGALSLFSYREKIQQMVESIPFSMVSSVVMWEIKVFILALIFVHAFFKFTWSLRQYNYVMVYVMAAPMSYEHVEEHEVYAQRGAKMRPPMPPGCAAQGCLCRTSTRWTAARRRGCCFLLEKPGPGIHPGGFVSRDNDTPTAAAIRAFMAQAGAAAGRDGAVERGALVERHHGGHGGGARSGRAGTGRTAAAAAGAGHGSAGGAYGGRGAGGAGRPARAGERASQPAGAGGLSGPVEHDPGGVAAGGAAAGGGLRSVPHQRQIVAAAVERLHVPVPNHHLRPAPEGIRAGERAEAARPAGARVLPAPAADLAGVQRLVEQPLAINGRDRVCRRAEALDHLGLAVADQAGQHGAGVRLRSRRGRRCHQQRKQPARRSTAAGRRRAGQPPSHASNASIAKLASQCSPM